MSQAATQLVETWKSNQYRWWKGDDAINASLKMTWLYSEVLSTDLRKDGCLGKVLKTMTELAALYLEMLAKYRWGRNPQLEQLAFWIRVNFQAMELPATVTPSGSLIDWSDAERACALVTVEERIQECKAIIRGPCKAQQGEPQDHTAGEYWEKYHEDIVSEYRSMGRAEMGETVSKLLRSKVSNPDFHSVFEAAVKAAIKAQHLHVLRVIEISKSIPAGSRFIRSVQTAPFTPPDPIYNRNVHNTISDLMRDIPKATLITEERFYYTFGQRLNTVCLDQVPAELEQTMVLQANVGQYYDKLGRSARTLVILRLIKAILEETGSCGTPFEARWLVREGTREYAWPRLPPRFDDVICSTIYQVRPTNRSTEWNAFRINRTT